MSKQSNAKELQGWQKKGPVCGNCKLFISKESNIDYGYGPYVTETTLRCSHGKFKTDKASWCWLYKSARLTTSPQKVESDGLSRPASEGEGDD